MEKKKRQTLYRGSNISLGDKARAKDLEIKESRIRLDHLVQFQSSAVSGSISYSLFRNLKHSCLVSPFAVVSIEKLIENSAPAVAMSFLPVSILNS